VVVRIKAATRSTSTDPRAEHVRRAIKKAALALAGERRVDDISVIDLVSRAGVSRPVFYHHFTDRDDAITQAVCEAMDSAVGQPAPADQGTRLVGLLAWTRTHAVLRGNLSSSGVAQGLVAHMRELIYPLCRSYAEAVEPGLSPGRLDVVTTFLVGGVLELLRHVQDGATEQDLSADDYLGLLDGLTRHPNLPDVP
jgi:AcrR family transcriptional regulator